jgi:hypothetical protein
METTWDITQTRIEEKKHLPLHVMEPLTTPSKEPGCQVSNGSRHQMLAVYMDAFQLAAMQYWQGSLLPDLMRAILHAIYSVFPAQTATDAPGTKYCISMKKLNKGNACWYIKKEVIGYNVNGENHTVQVPAPKLEALLKELPKVLHKQRLPLKRCQSLVGRRQHAARILLAAKSFFTLLNKALGGLPDFVGLGRNSKP